MLLGASEDYKYENGRRYHAYKEGTWLFPNDEVYLTFFILDL